MHTHIPMAANGNAQAAPDPTLDPIDGLCEAQSKTQRRCYRHALRMKDGFAVCQLHFDCEVGAWWPVAVELRNYRAGRPAPERAPAPAACLHSDGLLLDDLQADGVALAHCPNCPWVTLIQVPARLLGRKSPAGSTSPVPDHD